MVISSSGLKAHIKEAKLEMNNFARLFDETNIRYNDYPTVRFSNP